MPFFLVLYEKKIEYLLVWRFGDTLQEVYVVSQFMNYIRWWSACPSFLEGSTGSEAIFCFKQRQQKISIAVEVFTVLFWIFTVLFFIWFFFFSTVMYFHIPLDKKWGMVTAAHCGQKRIHLWVYRWRLNKAKERGNLEHAGRLKLNVSVTFFLESWRATVKTVVW